jgi:hypothetical protein
VDSLSGERKIILHTGLDKTGTTAIQNGLHANREFLLAEEGVLYPSLAANLSTPLLTIFKNAPENHRANRMAGYTTEEIAAHQKSYLNSLDTEISSREWGTLLLSAEGVSSLTESELAKLREWGEKYSSNWTILICVRHPVDWARSVIQERLKQGATLPQLYENPPKPRYRQKISNAISVFGRENVRIFDYDAATASNGGIVGAFADQGSLTASSRDLLSAKAVRINESLSLEAAHILDSLNRRRPVFVDNVRAPRRAGPRHELPYIRRIKGQKFDVPNPVKENIRLRSQEDVAWLNETFGLDLYRDVMDFAPLSESHEGLMEAVSDPGIDTIAEVLGELVTEKLFHRFVTHGRVALARGDFDGAATRFREAARLDPDAMQPKKLLKKAVAKQRANMGKPGFS